MIRIAVCDDEIYVTAQIENKIMQLKKRYNLDIKVDVFYDGKSLCDYINKCDGYDIIFLDIEMKNMDGVSAAKIIREKLKYVLFIFISNYDNYLRELFEVESFRFLDKPIDINKFEKYFFEAYKKISENSYFEFKFNKEIIKLYFNDIIYFESKNRLIFIFTNLKVYKFYGKLNDIEEQVRKSNKSFLRIHQSYLVNYDYIKIIRYHSVVMKNEIELQISEDRKKLIRNSLMQIIEEN